MSFDRQPLSPARKRRAFQQLAQSGQADGVSIGFANGVYSALLAASNPGLSASGGLHVLAHGPGVSIDGSGIFLSPFAASGASHAAGMVPDPGAAAGTTRFLREDATWQAPPAGAGTVTSVGLAAPGLFSVTGSPVTAAGTLALQLVNQSANLVFAGPGSGGAAAPAFRGLVAADLPAGTGTLTSVGLSMPADYTVTGSPVTAAGTLAVAYATQAANKIHAGPASGAAAAPTWRILTSQDLTIAALKNRLINGPMRFWQRGTSFSTASRYTADRWKIGSFGTSGAGTISQVALAASDPPQGSSYFNFALQWVQTANATGGTNPYLDQPIEDVNTLQGRTVTFSFWGKCSSGTVAAQTQLYQDFGTGGSPSAGVVTGPNAVTLTTTWQRFQWTVALPATTGKTLGSNGDHCLHFELLWPTAATFTVQVTGCQLEDNAAAATDFEFRPATLELLLCQRYYERSYSLTQANGTNGSLGPAIAPNTISSLAASTAGNVGEGTFLGFKVEKRATPTIVLYAFDGTTNGCHCENPAAATAAERYGATAGPVNAAGALQFITFDATGTFAISRGAILFAHWTAEAEL